MPNTIETELRQLRTILSWAVNSRLVSQMPATWVPPAAEPRDRHLTREEINTLLDAAELSHVRLFIVLAIATAARMNALLDLTWDRVDFARGLIYLHDPQRLRTTKGRAIVPMNDSARAALQHAKLSSVSDYAIEWQGDRIQNIRRAISTVLVKAGLKQVQDGAHLLRHTAAVFMAENGVPMSEISQYLGHRSTETTERVYARYSPDYLKRCGEGAECAHCEAKSNNMTEPYAFTHDCTTLIYRRRPAKRAPESFASEPTSRRLRLSDHPAAHHKEGGMSANGGEADVDPTHCDRRN